MDLNDFHDIFCDSCFPTDQGNLTEYTNEKLIQNAALETKGIDAHLLIRIDPNDRDPFPYFKKGEPYHLKRICDYFLVVLDDDTLYGVLIELKLGSGTALQQLDNSEVFWNFILETAKSKGVTISNVNKRVIKVKLRQLGKQPTKLALPQYDIHTGCITYSWNKFHVRKIIQLALENR